MAFNLSIETSNAAFGEDGDGADRSFEIARILRDLANQFEENGITRESGKLRDINGNDVGEWTDRID